MGGESESSVLEKGRNNIRRAKRDEGPAAAGKKGASPPKARAIVIKRGERDLCSLGAINL